MFGIRQLPPEPQNFTNTCAFLEVEEQRLLLPNKQLQQGGG